MNEVVYLVFYWKFATKAGQHRLHGDRAHQRRPKPGTNQLTAYQYDQLNRIKQVRAHRNFSTGNNAFEGSTGDDGRYHEDFAYDRNGNIMTVTRNGDHTGGTQLMDDFT